MDNIALRTEHGNTETGIILNLRVPQLGNTVVHMDSNEYAAAVAANIAHAIKEAGLSRNAVAVRSGISNQTLTRRFASNGGSPFTVREVKRIAEILGTTAADLLTVYTVERREVA